MPYPSDTLGNTASYDEQAIQMLSGFLSHINQTEGSSLPSSASVDLQYIHGLQQQRLGNKRAAIRIHYDRETRPISGMTWRMDYDTRYVTRIPFHIVNAKMEYLVNSRIQMHLEEKQNLYGYVIWLLGQHADMPYCCPNCGGATMTSKLVEGCPYCGTRFLMQELFPKITNYYTLSSPTNVTKYIKPFTVAGSAAMVVFYFAVNFGEIAGYATSGNWPMLILRLLQSVIALGGGAFLGYAVSSLVILAKVLKESVASVPHLVMFNHVKKQLPPFMRQFEPNFSLDHFVGKLISIVNILVYSDDLSNCALYGGDLSAAARQDTADIIDMRFCGYLDCGKCWVEQDYAYVNITVDMDDIYCQNGRIRRKKDRFHLLLCKNIHAETDYGFSIHAITCPNCGGSFDATKEKRCPYCETEYHLRDHDWVVLSFEKK